MLLRKDTKVIDFMQICLGFHKADVMARFDVRSKNTLHAETEEILSWVYPSLEHARDNPEVKTKRVDYAK